MQKDVAHATLQQKMPQELLSQNNEQEETILAKSN
jgi:hypothetical protein